jgi:hypothetical protein
MRCCRASIALAAFVSVPDGAAGFRGEAEVAVLVFVGAAFPAGALDGFFLFNEFIVVLCLSSLTASAVGNNGDQSAHKQTRHYIREITGYIHVNT